MRTILFAMAIPQGRAPTYPDKNQIILKHEGETEVFQVDYSNGELSLSITYNLASDGEENIQTTVYHCRKGEPMPD